MVAEIETGGTARNGDGLRCYLFGILFPVLYLTTAPNKNNRFVRFHAFQSIVFTIMFATLIIVSDFLRDESGSVRALLTGLWLVFFVTWVVLMVKAYRGEMFKLPIVGDLAAWWASR